MAEQQTLDRAEDTVALGYQLGEQLRAGDVVVLSGPLGAGKTVLAKGIAAGMDVEGPVTSPTFVLARVHRARRAGNPDMIHVDVYRLLDQHGADLVDRVGIVGVRQVDAGVEGLPRAEGEHDHWLGGHEAEHHGDHGQHVLGAARGQGHGVGDVRV